MRSTALLVIFLAACGVDHTSQPATDAAPGAASENEDVCGRFISCVYAAAPAQSAGADAAYGTDGTCWKTESRDVCLQGCTSGLQALHKQYPAACPLCTSDGDCYPGSCDHARGECVAPSSSLTCNSNAGCSNGDVCDTGSQRCVQCLVDTDCTGHDPYCATAYHVCVACNADSQCASNRCASNGECCVPTNTTCPSAPGTCGTQDDGCGHTIDCGTCSVGTCSNNRCTSQGQPCTPGPNACAPGEKCMVAAILEGQSTTYGYFCNAPAAPGSLGAKCATEAFCDYNNVYGGSAYYLCSAYSAGASCIQMCLTAADCVDGSPCSPYFAKDTISLQAPGYCHKAG